MLRSTGTDAAASSDGVAAGVLPALLAGEPEEATQDDVVHRYRGARLLYAAGARHIDVTASPADPTTVRLTVVWPQDAPSERKRAAFTGWWVDRAATLGWEPVETDELVGAVEVARYVATDAPQDDGGVPVVVHDWAPPRRDTSRTSGRRT
ncbi:hypothetical protein CAE01nite_20150 [Cellulomonas aerilata]|uniref:Uncharacterized protein n=1 Tax=Cellulomonas aerilata TaxID=515326 RepID=A0A512DDJ7_9CELL|nr:hypothetical protein CAE01nite_20150 [Cellulomonas aerilata]